MNLDGTCHLRNETKEAQSQFKAIEGEDKEAFVAKELLI